MATLEEITDRFKRAVGEDAGLGATLKFDLKGDGFIYIEGGSVTNEDKLADCTIIISKDNLEKLGQGKLDPAMAFMTGKIKLNGDMAVAMKLQPLFARSQS